MQTPRRNAPRAALILSLSLATVATGTVIALNAGEGAMSGASAHPRPNALIHATAAHRYHHRPSPAPTNTTAPAPAPTNTPAPAPTSTPAPAPTNTPAPAPSPAAGTSRYLSWIAIGYNPSDADLKAAVGKYDTIVFNTDDAAIATKMKQLDPAVTILAYEDLSSVRTYDGSKAIVTGVSYTEAQSKGWIAKDGSGHDITWNGYNGHVQTTIWNADYRNRWTGAVVGLIANSPFDGVYADNDMSSLKYYSGQLIAGTNNQDATDKLIHDGTDALIDQAGPALNAKGKKLVVNISDGRLDLSHWDRHSKYGGGQEENFISWSMTDWHPNLYDWGDTGWVTQTGLMARGPKSLAVTNAAAGDNRTLLYGYASFLIRAHSGDAWTGRDATGYNTAKLPAETTIKLGAPTGDPWQENGVWLRKFQGGMVIVNPQTSDRSYTAPASALDLNGNRLGTVSLPGMTARVARWQ